jgi:predicted trehalose synthase
MAMRKLPTIFRLPLAALALLGASSLALSQSPAPSPPAPRQPVISDDTLDDFAELNRNLTSLQSKIAKAKRIIAESQDPSRPANRREAFRAIVAGLLDAFADGGEVAQFGRSAVDFVHQRLADAQQDTNFPPEQKEALVTRWRRLATQTETVVASLDTTRKELGDKLELLRTKADFVDQMEKLRQARDVLDVIGDLADQRQAVSERLRDLLEGRPNDAPGM